MADNNGGERCEFCWIPYEYHRTGEHNEGCPLEVWDFARQGQWDAGWRHGFNDNTIPCGLWGYYPKSFILGYRAGKAEIDRLIDEAAQARCI